jgi:hypothetical protein
MTVIFVLPRGLGTAAVPCLPWKRTSDLWACLYYSREQSPATKPTDATPRFLTNREALAAEMARAVPGTECAPLWHSIARAASTESGGFVGRRNLIVISEPGMTAWAGPELISGVIASQSLVQVICSGPDAALEEFCRRVGGIFCISDKDAVLQAYLNLYAHYEVVYESRCPEALALKIRLHGAGISAETQLPLTASAQAGTEAEEDSNHALDPTES